ncbi:hypothetical protein [Paraburkholderia kirstenboschensis]|uniref:Uncharacterized protein n=1 Tax=Paraburkholderia kirstenboschensis TaxID=1245436 RepID=A0ABZ0EIL3_9BURK|nr:hypothetical protein [Paraburkholderia kirstenboschensis]WOD17036.1 hypothetical protein RW095_14455 [Paraburkholderia kirstenboschensis]
MTRRYTLEVLAEDEGLVDRPSNASFTLASRTSENGVAVTVLETLDEALAAQWTQILDDNDRAHVSRVLEGDDVISDQSVRSPSWSAK